MEPNRNNNQNNRDPKQPQKPKGNLWVSLIIAAAVLLLISSIYNSVVDSQYTQTNYNDFLQAVEANNLEEVLFKTDRIIYLTKEEAAKPAAQQKACYTGLPKGANVEEISRTLYGMGVINSTEIVEDNSGIMLILYYAMMFGIMFMLMNSITKRMSGDGMMGGFGKSKAKVYMEKQTGVTFKDVAGQDEAKESLQEIIDFLHDPQKYTDVGAKLPKGALLVGSPGTG